MTDERLTATNQRYGPNTAAVEAVVGQCRAMAQGESKAMNRASWRKDSLLPLVEAWDIAERATLAGRRQAFVRAYDDVWSALPATTLRIAACDAVLALVVRDLITQEQFDLLTAPWVSVMGEAWGVAS